MVSRGGMARERLDGRAGPDEIPILPVPPFPPVLSDDQKLNVTLNRANRGWRIVVGSFQEPPFATP